MPCQNPVGTPRRRSGRRTTLLALCCAVVAGCGGSPVGPSIAPLSPTVIPGAIVPGRVAIVSIDGLRPEAIHTTGAPNILALATRGAYSWHAQTILPSTTLPAHVSMLTGHTPSVHRMVWDEYTPGRPIPVPTVFGLARGAGRRTAMIAGKHKFTYFCEMGDCDIWAITSGGDDDVAGRASGGTAADLIFVHLPDVDLTGHAEGWMSNAYMAAVRRADMAFGRIVASLPPDTTVILTADHGGHLNDHGSSDRADMTIPWIAAGPRIVRGRALSSAILTVDTAATAAYVLGVPLDPSAEGRPVLEAFLSY